ncbi:uncharacterized protein LOC131327628, partial [Rhododendron vialii]|uniref:uncharacterized protein LOC131327628 n=1 Tax=Rhododendron vialii TaxID=182163 RepID=UPI00265DA39B
MTAYAYNGLACASSNRYGFEALPTLGLGLVLIISLNPASPSSRIRIENITKMSVIVYGVACYYLSFWEERDEQGGFEPVEEAVIVKDPDFWESLLFNDLAQDLDLGMEALIAPSPSDKGKRKLGEVPVDLWNDSQDLQCVDFRDLNKASPKDDFPLPHIDVLVDNTAGHALLSFMDGFSGYNQILMAPEDREKTTFITEWGTYCYLVMPFGLKNAGPTYQRAATTILHDMMHKEVEVYVDDMIAKSKTREGHVPVLRKFFERLRKFRMRLNPQKCTF